MVAVHESRVQVSRTAGGLRVEFARWRPWWRFAMPAWLLVIVSFGVVGMLGGDQPRDGGATAFLVVWVGFGLALGALSLWGLLYREHLELDAQQLVHVRRLGPVRRERSYARERIEDLRMSPESISPMDPRAGLRIYGVGGGTVAFDYGDRTYRVADVEEAEAKRVVAALRAEGLGAS